MARLSGATVKSSVQKRSKWSYSITGCQVLRCPRGEGHIKRYVFRRLLKVATKNKSNISQVGCSDYLQSLLRGELQAVKVCKTRKRLQTQSIQAVTDDYVCTPTSPLSLYPCWKVLRAETIASGAALQRCTNNHASQATWQYSNFEAQLLRWKLH